MEYYADENISLIEMRDMMWWGRIRGQELSKSQAWGCPCIPLFFQAISSKSSQTHVLAFSSWSLFVCMWGPCFHLPLIFFSFYFCTLTVARESSFCFLSNVFYKVPSFTHLGCIEIRSNIWSCSFLQNTFHQTNHIWSSVCRIALIFAPRVS